jgi:hypothetical protein
MDRVRARNPRPTMTQEASGNGKAMTYSRAGNLSLFRCALAPGICAVAISTAQAGNPVPTLPRAGQEPESGRRSHLCPNGDSLSPNGYTSGSPISLSHVFSTRAFLAWEVQSLNHDR